MASSLNGNVGIVTFVAEFDYIPQVEGEIELHKGDLCVVAKPIIDPCGWLEGTNKNSNEYGQFPGTYVTVVEDFTPPPPPRPPKPTPLAPPAATNLEKQGVLFTQISFFTIVASVTFRFRS